MSIQSLARSVTDIVFGLVVAAHVNLLPEFAIINIKISTEAIMQTIGAWELVAWRALVGRANMRGNERSALGRYPRSGRSQRGFDSPSPHTD